MEKYSINRYPIILFLLLPLILGAAPSRTQTYTTGEVIDPADVTENEDNIFRYLQTGVDTYVDSSIIDADISTGINASKIADGTVSNAEFQYINSLNSNAQTQITNLLNGTTSFSGLTASADLDIGSFELRAQTFESDVATGTAPFTIASTTVSTNLNADLLDGYSALSAPTTAGLSGRQVFTSDGNFTAPASITQVYLFGCGGGGGGGGVTAASSGGGGGASGGMLIKYPYTVTPTSVYAVAIGALGAGGAAGDNNGASGGNTTFDSSVTATGGQGGQKGTVRTGGTSPGNALNANGQTAGNYIYGGSGADGASGNPAVGGGGGGCFFGAGGAGGNTSTAGSDGLGYCSGGGGGGSGAIRAGGSGAAGILIVEW